MVNRSYTQNDWNNFIDQMTGKHSKKNIEFIEKSDSEFATKPIAIGIAIKDFNNNCTEFVWQDSYDIKYLSLLKEEIIIVTVSIKDLVITFLTEFI